MNKRLSLYIGAVLSFLLIIACGKSDLRNNRPDPEDTAYRLTMIVPLLNHPFWKLAAEGMYEAGSKYDFDIQYTGPAEINLEKQIEYIETAIAARVDGIITQALDPEIFGQAIEKAAVAGIPVVLIDSDAPDSTRNYYVGTPNFAAGEAAGQAMIEATNGKARIGIITGVENQLNLNERIAGFRQAVSEYPEMHITATEVSGIDVLKAMQITKNMLIKYPEINAFFGVSADDIQGTAKAISEKNNRDSYVLVGFDDMEYTIESIRTGAVYAAIVQNPYEMGKRAVELLERIRKNQAPKEEVFNTGFIVVNKSNVDTYHGNSQSNEN